MAKANFTASAERHYLDALLLEKSKRIENAGQLYGFCAECGIKALLISFGYPTDSDEQSYGLFSDTLYDVIPPPNVEDDEIAFLNEEELFNFDIEVENAPHYPSRINWNNRFQEFDAKLLGQGLFSEAEIEASFGSFMHKAMQFIEDSSS